jgi:hypothetical protein
LDGVATKRVAAKEITQSDRTGKRKITDEKAEIANF